MFKKSEDKWSTVTFQKEWLELRSSWDICRPDIFIKRELLKGYIVKERLKGFAKVDLYWEDKVTSAWLLEVQID